MLFPPKLMKLQLVFVGIMSVLLSQAFIATPTLAGEEISNIARGGQLYDKWYKVIKAEKPKATHPAWPASNTKKKGDATQRCKACHGWDLSGKDGAYAAGSYKTGITGLRAMQGVDPQKIIAIIKDETHGFAGKMDEQDYMDMALFVSKGQIDMNAVIDLKTKKVKGDPAVGEPLYNTVCANCHAKNGSLPKDMPMLGKLANKNPWEVLQKIMNGQPGEKMPALRAFDQQVAVDVLAYLQTLPKQ